MKLDAKTLACMYAIFRDEWRKLEKEIEFANEAMDYDKVDELNEELEIVRNNVQKVKTELGKFSRKEDAPAPFPLADAIKSYHDKEDE